MSRGRQEKRPRAQSSMIRILPARGKDGEKNNLELKLQPTDNQPRFEQKKTPCPTMPTRKRAPYPRTPTGKSTQARTEKSPLPQNADRKKHPGPNRKEPPTPERRQEKAPRPEQKRPPYPRTPTGKHAQARTEKTPLPHNADRKTHRGLERKDETRPGARAPGLVSPVPIPPSALPVGHPSRPPGGRKGRPTCLQARLPARLPRCDSEAAGLTAAPRPSAVPRIRNPLARGRPFSPSA